MTFSKLSLIKSKQVRKSAHIVRNYYKHSYNREVVSIQLCCGAVLVCLAYGKSVKYLGQKNPVLSTWILNEAKCNGTCFPKLNTGSKCDRN
jgi:hypothetical protein